MERIEYHDPFPDEFMAKLRRLYGAAETPDHDDFTARLDHSGLTEVSRDKAEVWLRRCACSRDDDPDEHCEVHLVLKHCDLFAETVETEFERIQSWYRTPRFAADEDLREIITEFRTPGRERDTGRLA